MGRINDLKIKELIEQHNNTGQYYDEIISHLSEYIYNYPRISFHQPEDVCGDYFLHIHERLPKILLKYKSQDCLFVTWFTVVLRHQYINWIKKYNNIYEKKIIYIEDYQYDEEFHFKEEDNWKEEQEIQQNQFVDILNSLPKKVKVVMKLYFFSYFKAEDLVDVSKIFKRDISLLLSQYDKLLQYSVEQYDKEKIIMDKVNTSFQKVQILKEKYTYLSDTEKQSEMGQNIMNQIGKTEIGYKRNLNKYQQFQVLIKNDMISDFLGISVNAIHNLMFRGKSLIKQKIQDKSRE